ncbi:MAG: ORF6N domain-containing protein [Lachnospiraceae bacterium]
MQVPSKIEVQGIRVLTTRQLANAYDTTLSSINNNFSRNKKRYIIGKHYIPIEGEELKQLRSSHQIDGELKGVPKAYLWTEKGALLHAKSLNTDKAWEVYDYLVDFYFRAKEETLLPAATQKALKAPKLPVSAPALPPTKGIPKMTNPILILHVLLDLASDCGMSVASFDFNIMRSALHNKNIGIRSNSTVEETAYELAFELAHAIVHNGYGDMVKSPLAKEYNQHAERIADFIIRALDIKIQQIQ